MRADISLVLLCQGKEQSKGKSRANYFNKMLGLDKYTMNSVCLTIEYTQWNLLPFHLITQKTRPWWICLTQCIPHGRLIACGMNNPWMLQEPRRSSRVYLSQLWFLSSIPALMAAFSTSFVSFLWKSLLAFSTKFDCTITFDKTTC